MDAFSLFLDACGYEIVCVTEHWQSANELTILKLNNYNLISCYCRAKGKHGGAAIYARDNIMTKPINLDKYTLEVHAEFCGVELLNSN